MLVSLVYANSPKRPALVENLAGWITASFVRSSAELAFALQERKVDVAFLCLRGVRDECCKIISAARRQVPVIVLAGAKPSSKIAELLDAGADDVISSRVQLAELKARVFAVLRRRQDVGDHPPANDANDLRRAEQKLLRYLLAQEGRIVSQGELIKNVFGGAHAIDTALVRVHISRLRKKLGPLGPNLKTFRGLGYAIGRTVLSSDILELLIVGFARPA